MMKPTTTVTATNNGFIYQPWCCQQNRMERSFTSVTHWSTNQFAGNTSRISLWRTGQNPQIVSMVNVTRAKKKKKTLRPRIYLESEREVVICIILSPIPVPSKVWPKKKILQCNDRIIIVKNTKKTKNLLWYNHTR